MTNVLKSKTTDQLMKIYGLQSIDGGSAESLNFRNYPEFDESDLYKGLWLLYTLLYSSTVGVVSLTIYIQNSQVTIDLERERHTTDDRQPSPSAMAPTTTIETITITRPLKVIAFICGFFVVILMIMALTSTDWLLSTGWRQGLFFHCISEDAELPLPFGIQDTTPGCHLSRDKFYIKFTALLCIIAAVTDAIATLLTGLGLKTTDANLKYKLYRIAVLVMLAAFISLLVALIYYPVLFAAELSSSNREIWEFGWAYGVGWGALIFLFGAVVLLLCDKESEEIYYKERKIVHESSSVRD